MIIVPGNTFNSLSQLKLLLAQPKLLKRVSSFINTSTAATKTKSARQNSKANEKEQTQKNKAVVSTPSSSSDSPCIVSNKVIPTSPSFF